MGRLHTLPGRLPGMAQYRLCSLSRLLGLLLLPHRVGRGAELFLIPIHTAQPPDSVLALALPFLKNPALLLCCTAFLFLSCSRFRVRIHRVRRHGIYSPYFLLRWPSVWFVFMNKMSAGCSPSFPQGRDRTIFHQRFPLPDSLLLHLLRGSIASFRVGFRCRQYPLLAFFLLCR